MKNKIKILDCSLRDGGYYNNWDFDFYFVNKYLNCIKNASIDAVEIGFRFKPKSSFVGPLAYTTDEYLKQFNLPKKILFGVMINANEFIKNGVTDISLINNLFSKSTRSPISLVRIAINFDYFEKAESIATKLNNLGYIVGINLMQSGGKTKLIYEKTSKIITSWKNVDILNFADSLGNMNPKNVKLILSSLKTHWKRDMGIHTHNNKGLALINSLTAAEKGINWIDSTITGMGRGAGNASTESLLLELNEQGSHDGDAMMLQPILEDFNKLKSKYGWGSNLYYHYAANNNIHPTFVQSLLADEKYDKKQVLESLEILSKQKSTSYSAENLRLSIYGDNNISKGSWIATNWLKDREVLIVGSGKSVKKYKKGIIHYIKRNNPAVLFLNINKFLPENIAEATIVCHEKRVLFEAKSYKKLKKPIIVPKSKFTKLIYNELKGCKILDYGLNLQKNKFKIKSTYCILHRPLASAYAFAIVTQAGAKKISLIGFDGYLIDNIRQEVMNQVFKDYSKLKISKKITSLTPSLYNIKNSSIFSK